MSRTIAIVRQPPPTFAQCVTEVKDAEIDLELAQQQWTNYTTTLRKHVDEVISLPTLPLHPDCCFVEDTTVVVQGRALVNRLGHPTRRGEEADMMKTLSKLLGPGNVKLMADENNEATLDGGDVLYTGRHLFVGQSRRSNAAGISVLKAWFEPQVQVVAVPLEGEALHLKCVVSALNDGTLVVSDDLEGRAVWMYIQKCLPDVYEVVWVRDRIAANVLALPERKLVFVQANYPQSRHAISMKASELGYTVEELNMSENTKADGALTCLSVLVHLP